ncbi:uncharacterized protein tti2 isoform X2 [Nematolebias whitei]|uniref:uncharacterized protein tti2 isoform X2 n=1 Tax=Nematolebias whitei TaxID=451745 RepID=UPI001899AD4F|nr:uncharacterized protein tti2 isoform X2 [Nematolebias whitei]
MDLSSLLHDLRLSSSPSEKPHPSPPLPPITELLSWLQKKLIGAADKPSESSSLIGQVAQLFKAADPDWLFSLAPDDQNSGWEELQVAYSSVISALIGCAALPLCENDSSSLSAEAYRSVPSQAAAVSSALTALLEHWDKGGRARGKVTKLVFIVAPPICVFSITHFQLQDQVWTSAASRTAARRLHEALLRAGGWTDSAHLLMGDRGILGGVLDLLQPQLTKDSWQRCEAMKLVFVWTLLQVTRPFLSPHLPLLLPPSLLLNDHYKPENCMLGVRCLHHIVLNTPAADLRQFNRAEVLYQALFKHLYTSEAAVIQDGRVCVQTPAAGGAGGAGIPGGQRSTGGDEPAEDPGGSAENHQRGVATVMERRVDAFLPSLLRLLVDVSSDSSLGDPVRRQLMDQSSASIRLLDACSHGRVQRLLQRVDDSCCGAEVLGCLATAERSPVTPGGGALGQTDS